MNADDYINYDTIAIEKSLELQDIMLVIYYSNKKYNITKNYINMPWFTTFDDVFWITIS